MKKKKILNAKKGFTSNDVFVDVILSPGHVTETGYTYLFLSSFLRPWLELFSNLFS